MKKKLLLLSLVLSNYFVKASTVVIAPTVDAVIQSTSYTPSWSPQPVNIPIGNSMQVYNTLYVNLKPGDTLFMNATNLVNGIFTRTPIQFRELKGTALLPIVIKNQIGKTIQITQLNNNNAYGLSFHLCQNIKLSGLENTTSKKIIIKDFSNPASVGISFDRGTKNVEVEHLEFANINGQAILFKSAEPFNGNKVVTDTAYFRQYLNTKSLGKGIFHDNYIHNIANDAMFIGSTIFDIGNPINITINQSFANSFPSNNDILQFSNGTWQFTPHFIDTILIYNNQLDTLGQDGIQIAMTKHYRTYNNTISNWGIKKIYGQMAGIIIATPSIGETYNNRIKNGNGSAIQCFGINNRIFNNLIINPNIDSKQNNWWEINAIYFNDKACTQNTLTKVGLTYSQTNFEAAHNTIILHKTDSGRAVFFMQNFRNSTISKCYNNLSVKDPNPDSLNTMTILLPNALYSANPVQSNFSTQNNFTSTDLQTVNFENIKGENYEIKPFSLASKTGRTLNVSAIELISRDMNGESRIFNPKTNLAITNPSFGCFESHPSINISVPASIDVVVQATSYSSIFLPKTVIIPLGGSYKVNNFLYTNLEGGDTLSIDANTNMSGIYSRTPIIIKGLVGNEGNPITIKNKTGKIIQITKANSSSSFGIDFQYCQNIRVTGKENNLNYQLKINGITSSAGMGISFGNCTRNVELCYVELCNLGGQAVQYKTNQPYNQNFAVTDTAFCRSYVNMQNLGYGIFHHNYIHNVGSEGIYVGTSGYDVNDGIPIVINNSFASSLPINSLITKINNTWYFLPHLADSVLIYENTIDSTGWDGIQVACSKNYSVNDNQVSNYGLSKSYYQMYGIIIGAPCSGIVYNNTIKTGNGSAIQCFGINNRFFNNLIVNPNLDSKEKAWWAINGVYFSDKTCTPKVLARLGLNYSQTLFEFAHNTVILNKTDSGRAVSFFQLFPQSIAKCYNNIVVRDPNPDSLNISPIMILNPIITANPIQNNFSNMNNFISTDLQTIGFRNIVNGDYRLTSNSVASRSGIPLSQPSNDQINWDLNSISRRIDAGNNSFIPNPSFGCYETSISNYFTQQEQKKPLVNISTHPNPINENDLLSLVINIETTNPKSNYILILTDIMGKTFSYKLSNMEGTNQYKLNTEALQFISRGIYFGVIKHENETIGTIKLMLN